jgi:hypothetical protein
MPVSKVVFAPLNLSTSNSKLSCSGLRPYTSSSLSLLSGFWPRVRARALCAPVFLGSSPRQTGRSAPRRPSQLRCFFLCIPKIKIFYLTRAARVKGFFLSTLPPWPESIQSARPSIQSSELGPPPPQLQESVAPPLDPRGETHSLPDEGVSEGNQFWRWGIHSGTPSIL